MLVALLLVIVVVSGVDLLLLALITAAVTGRRRWVMSRPGAFTGAVRLASGTAEGFSPRWHGGSGRWVRDVLVWTRAPWMLRTDHLAVDRVEGERPARAGELRRLGDAPAVLLLAVGDATVELAVAAHDRATAQGADDGSASRPA